MCAKPTDLAVAINPVVAIVPTAQIFNDAILVPVMNGEYLPVVFGDVLRSEVLPLRLIATIRVECEPFECHGRLISGEATTSRTINGQLEAKWPSLLRLCRRVRNRVFV